MENILLIGFNSNENLEKGSASWRGKYLDDIFTATDFDNINPENTKNAIGYFAGRADSEKYCIDLDINEISKKENFLKIGFSILGKNDIKSSEIKSAILKIIRDNKNGVNNFPFCVGIEKENLNSLIDEDFVLKKLKSLKANNDWPGIYKMAEPVNGIKNKAHLWNNVKVLDTFSFACAKLSEVYINLRFQFNSDTEKNNFLRNQKKYREETIMLRERCIELFPDNPAYYSNLGYSYYQFVRELMTPGGRRDGKILDEADKCLLNINKALELDPNRITDLYRKGQILTSVYPVNLMYSKGKPSEEIRNECTQKIKEGIAAFQKAEEVYEVIPLIDEKSLIRYHKEYIKSLYNLAGAYSELVKYDWDYTLFYINYKNVITDFKENIQSEEIDKALYYIEKCITKDSCIKERDLALSQAIEAAKSDGGASGVYKLYSAGKYYFQKYWYLSGYGKSKNIASDEARVNAEKYLSAALRFPFPENLKRQSKAFIAERLCRVLLTKGEFVKGVEILKPYIKEKTDYYIRYTYSTALYKSGKYDEAKHQIKKSMENIKSNKEIWLGHFMLSCIDIKKGDLTEADVNLHKAITEAGKSGKKNTDSLYLAGAFIHYKAGCKETAVKFLETAIKINPHRRGVKERLNKWKTGESDFDLLEI